MSNEQRPESPCDNLTCACRNCPDCRTRAEAATRAPETASDYLARVSDAAVAYAIEAERLRTFLKDCGCPCCSARARLRTLREDSYNRACESPADIHCASTDRRDDNADTTVIYSNHDAKESLGAAVRQAIQTDSSGGGQSSHPDAR